MIPGSGTSRRVVSASASTTVKPVTRAGAPIHQVRGEQVVAVWLQTDRLGILQHSGRCRRHSAQRRPLVSQKSE